MLEDGKKILKLFPLPIFHYKVKDYEKHNENLAKYIYNLYKNDDHKWLILVHKMVRELMEIGPWKEHFFNQFIIKNICIR